MAADINIDGRLLPGDLRGLLGLPADVAPIPSPQNLYDLAPVPVAPIAAPMPELQPIAPPPDIVMPAITPKPAWSPKASAATPSAAPAAPAGPRMPTIAETTAMQADAARQELNATQAATDTAVRQAGDIHALNQQADADLKAGIAEQKQWQERSDQIRLDKEAAAAAALKEVDSYKIDPNRYWNEAGTAKQIGWFIAMALSGLGDALQRKSGPNVVIGMLDATIDRDLKVQMDQRDQLKEKLGRAQGEVDKWDRFSANKDARFLAQRAQAKELVAQQLLTAASKYGGDAALANGAKVAAEIRKGAAKDMAQAVDMAHGHQVQDEQLKISKQQVAIAGSQAANAAEHLKFEKQKFAYQMAHDQQLLELEAAKLDAKAGAAVKNHGVGGVAVAVKDKDGKVTGITQDVMKQKDGSVWTIDDASERKEIRKVKAAADTMLHMIDESMRIRTGWTSDTAKSKEWQELKANWAALKVTAKDLLGLGVLAGPDMELIDGFIGSDDPTRMRGVVDGVARARKNILRLANDKFHAAGFDGEYAPASLSQLMQPVLDDNQQAFKDLSESKAGSRAGFVPGVIPGVAMFEDSVRKVIGADVMQQLSDDEKQKLLNFAQLLNSNSEAQSDVGRLYLNQLAVDGPSKTVREAASSLLRPMSGALPPDTLDVRMRP